MKQFFIGLLTGGGLAGAIVAVCGNYYVERYKHNLDLRLQEVARQRSAYQDLARGVNDLDREIDDAIKRLELKLRYPRDVNLAHDLKQSIQHISDRMAVVYNESRSPDIDSEVARATGQMLDEVGVQLQPGKRDLDNLSNLAKLYEEKVKKKIAELQKLISDKFASLTVSSLFTQGMLFFSFITRNEQASA